MEYAEKLYSFGETFKGKYSDSISDANQFYRSYSGYYDELTEAAAILHLATGQDSYLQKAEEHYANGSQDPWGQSWDEKWFSVNLLLYDITGKIQYMEKINGHLLEWFNKPKVEGKFSFLSEWGGLRYAANTAFLALIALDKFSGDVNFTAKNQVELWAKGNIDYMLGDNSHNFSF